MPVNIADSLNDSVCPHAARRSRQTIRPVTLSSMPSSLCDSRTCFTQSLRAPTLRKQRLPARTVTCQEAGGCTPASVTTQPLVQESLTSRRQLLAASICSTALASLLDQPAQAVQGYTAGRIPGTSKTLDADGFYTYTRPEGKQGGHGVGWSELPRYAFKVPPGWQETAVSIADLGGTEIDLRFANPEEGSLEVVVAPVMRFKDIEFNANVKIEDIAPPERIISGFALEIFGAPLAEDDVLQQDVESKDGRTYYSWEIKPHRLVSATAVKNRLILLSINASPRQWRKSQDHVKHMWKSLEVVKV